ncbi:uncharacterized protein PAN0_001d0038 [Moesziomyces antarcticus]|uniref:Secreted protein n=1 Tax=Pseudozyma antarctica TaxID=84753 RepID=A0A5C3FFS1_PSEA2|nr:uncharacterized protein PAN0_001d0038 [Moesziomyces antarcticus]GAK61843.1 hypothetical protein PAN0_001d0038 [Moesziomyces antarcticus]SPO42361.1 uncharacterized protein PSANT_00044 [Moesziomyces antarcticus]
MHARVPRLGALRFFIAAVVLPRYCSGEMQAPLHAGASQLELLLLHPCAASLLCPRLGPQAQRRTSRAIWACGKEADGSDSPGNVAPLRQHRAPAAAEECHQSPNPGRTDSPYSLSLPPTESSAPTLRSARPPGHNINMAHRRTPHLKGPPADFGRAAMPSVSLPSRFRFGSPLSSSATAQLLPP